MFAFSASNAASGGSAPQSTMPKAKAPPRAQLAALQDDWSATEPWIAAGKKVLIGLVLMSGLFGFVTINGAVVTSGTVMVESNTKTVQHLDGGIVKSILVKNGDAVKAGDAIVLLDDSQIRANLGVARGHVLDARTQQLRLEAERDGKTVFTPPELPASQMKDPQVLRMFEAQQALFTARKHGRMGEQSMLNQRLEQLKNDLDGAQQQLDARHRELNFLTKELRGVQPLYDKGFINQARLGPLQRDEARIRGDVGRLVTDVEKGKAALAEAALKLAQSEKDFQSQVAEDLRKALGQLTEASETMAGLEDKMARITIRAPRAGRIAAMTISTIGGVIPPGGALAQVVPEDEQLVVEAHIQPGDVDKVREGSLASVKFPAFNAKSTPKLEGRVATVSATTLKDQDQQNKPYYLVQVQLSADELAKLGRGHKLLPGMPAEVYIETTSRSILSYVVKPIADLVSHLGRDG